MLKKGLRVFVENLQGNALGFGTYVGEVPLAEATSQLPIDEELQEVIKSGATTAKIILDPTTQHTAEVAYGQYCSWQEIG
ncbi:hypothetical protein H7X87_04515, partial [Acetobacteraceae bacterium]|nr:hypothetical protein [Candidatus Parcubacteria bacterium]